MSAKCWDRRRAHKRFEIERHRMRYFRPRWLLGSAAFLDSYNGPLREAVRARQETFGPALLAVVDQAMRFADLVAANPAIGRAVDRAAFAPVLFTPPHTWDGVYSDHEPLL